MRRRDFLRQTGTAALAATAGAPFVHASDKAGTKPPVIGTGEHRYECHHGWGQLPDHVKWFETHGVAVDREGLVYVTHRAGSDRPKEGEGGQDTVVVFDPSGRCVRTFGKQWHGGGHGVDVRVDDGKEYLYLCQMFPVNLVIKTDLEGNVVWTKDRESLAPSHVYDKPEARFSPTNVAFGPDGGFYVGDGYGSNYIHQYDAKGEWVRTWGGTGAEPGKFKTPHGLWWDARAREGAPGIVVADRANNRLQYFAPDGAQGRIVEKGIRFPAHFDTRGDVLMVADLHAIVTLLDRDDNVIVQLGGEDEAWIEEVKKLQIRQDPSKWLPGRFVHPHDACFDHDGNIYVAEWVPAGRVSFLRRVS